MLLARVRNAARPTYAGGMEGVVRLPGDQWGTGQEALPELGAVRCAELLARRTGLPVTAGDMEELAARGLVHVTRLYKRRPMYRVAEVEAVAADPVSRALLAGISTAHSRG
jgi:hypothetical protein